MRARATTPTRRRPGPPRAEVRAVPLRERALRLVAEPTPRQLDRHVPHVAVARLADPLLVMLRPALVRRRHEPGQRPDLAPVAERAPAEELADQHRGDRLAHGPQPRQLPHLRPGPGLRRVRRSVASVASGMALGAASRDPRGPPRRPQRQHPRREVLHLGPLAPEARQERRRQRRAVPAPHRA